MVSSVVASVYVEKAVYHIDKPFDYVVPPEFSQNVKRGCRVLVPFGNSNKKVQGLVCEVFSVDESKRLKPVFAVIDKEPVITEEFFKLIDFLVKTTFCSFYDAVKCILPAGKNVEVVEIFKLKDNILPESYSGLNEGEKRIVEFLRSAKTARELNLFLDCKAKPQNNALVKRLLNEGIIERADRERPRIAKRTVKMVRVNQEFDLTAAKLSAKQRGVLDILFEVQVAAVKETAYLAGVTPQVVINMGKKAILEIFDRESEMTLPYELINQERGERIELSEQQEQAYDGIIGLVKEKKPAVSLLYGITGSGKTQVYMRIIEQVTADGRNAMLLVPEIALTPQLLAKFYSYFGGGIAVIHSNLSVTERLTEFERMRKGKANIVIGTRSAVFAPLENIGVIIMDEEGETSYRSDKQPRFHAREVAKFRCVQGNCVLVLGSATPSIDSYYKAQSGQYSIFTIEERYANAILPSVYIVDMLAEQSSGNLSPISDVLKNELARNIERGEQSILLINRRGYNTFATCTDCGEVVKCQSCDVAMTYHKVNGCLMCHHCGRIERFTGECQSCSGKHIKLTGVGTQKLEDALVTQLPNARLLRMDSDTTYGKNSYEKAFEDFKNHKYDIMLGTQMIAKGLDFPDVTLVGVLNADSGLYSDDFRASERVFSLITQVVGRSGRSEKSGRAYIQTQDPKNPVINFAARQDYTGFYEDEIYLRKAMTIPPFCDIVTLMISSENEQMAKKAAAMALDILKDEASGKEKIAMKVMGVSQAGIYRLNNKYRFRILIKCKMNNAMREIISATLKRCGGERAFAKVTCMASVNGDIE